MLNKIAPLLLLLAGCSYLSAGTVDIQLDPPGGNIIGLPGDHVGWGFTITNNTSLWLFFSTSTLDFETNPGLGSYTDFFSNNSGNDTSNPLALVDPSSTWGLVPYSYLGQAGVGDYWIDPGAGLGASDSGTITVYYEGFDCNPNVCGSPIETDGTTSAAFNVTVGTPEPSTTIPLALLACGWVGLQLRRRFAK